MARVSCTSTPRGTEHRVNLQCIERELWTMPRGADGEAARIAAVTIKGVFRSARKTLTLGPGEVLFSAGDVGDEMYGVISGLFELRRGDRVVQRVGPDGTFGELAIIDASPRTLTAVAVESSEIAVINRHEFLFLVHETPTFAIDVMRSLSSLIRELNLNTRSGLGS